MTPGEQYNHEAKVYVDVTALFRSNGQVEPQTIIWEDGRVFQIDEILDVRRAASLKAGGCGIRYTCKVCGRPAYLFLEEDRWFVERR